MAQNPRDPRFGKLRALFADQDNKKEEVTAMKERRDRLNNQIQDVENEQKVITLQLEHLVMAMTRDGLLNVDGSEAIQYQQPMSEPQIEHETRAEPWEGNTGNAKPISA